VAAGGLGEKFIFRVARFLFLIYFWNQFSAHKKFRGEQKSWGALLPNAFAWLWSCRRRPEKNIHAVKISGFCEKMQTVKLRVPQNRVCFRFSSFLRSFPRYKRRLLLRCMPPLLLCHRAMLIASTSRIFRCTDTILFGKRRKLVFFPYVTLQLRLCLGKAIKCWRSIHAHG